MSQFCAWFYSGVRRRGIKIGSATEVDPLICGEHFRSDQWSLRSVGRLRGAGRLFNTASVLLLLASAIGPARCSGGIIRLDNSSGGLGELLDGITQDQIGSAAAGPLVVPGLGSAADGFLSVTVMGLNGGGELNSTSQSLGINSIGSDSTSRFDADFSEFVEFRFDRQIRIGQLDFTSFSAEEAFRIAGFDIAYDDLANKSTDIFLFSSPLTIPPNVPLQLQATAGQIGIEAWDLEFSPAATPDPDPNPGQATVPEPSSLALMAGLCVGIGCGTRQRKHRRPSDRIHGRTGSDKNRSPSR